MVKYTCDTCGDFFDRKSNFDNHLARKTKCNKKSGSKTNKKNIDPKCYGCEKTFSRKDSLVRHMKNCKSIINKNKGNKNVTIGDIKGDVINNNKGVAIKGNKNIANVNSPVYNVNLVFFGKDGIDSLDFNDFVKIIKSNNNLYEALITSINFDPKKPQHHNVYYPDMKASCGKVYENKKWVNKKINEIINIMLDTKRDDLNTMMDKLGDTLSKKTRQNIIKTIEDTDYSKPICRKKLISYIKPILHNNKDMVIKTKKLLEGLSENDIEYADNEVFKKGTKLNDIKKIYNEKINKKK